eukprot:TRINITY_DN4035_c0_g1_i1.p1 TRINITY_DN4035_c0_g1~~TRINITY_DN4035_c0_g1_i1.p1  ORF type:complete len:536 (-),score=218.35 TRINITY_DN4035_c0_g1_i1:120-1727(-)
MSTSSSYPSSAPIRPRSASKVVKSREEKERFTRDVRRAFQACAAQLTGLVFIAVIYNCYSMIEDQAMLFIWALFLSIILKKPKEYIVYSLEGVEEYEKEGYIAKFTYLLTNLCVNRYTVCFFLLLMLSHMSCTLGIMCGLAQNWIVVVVMLLILALATMFTYVKSEDYVNFVSMTIVVGFFVVGSVFAIFFLVQAITESMAFGFQVKKMVEDKINDPTWADLFNEYGINAESINNYTIMAQEKAGEWVEEQGYNITEISDMIGQYSQKNTTELQDDLMALDFIKIKDMVEEKIDLTSLSGTMIGIGEVLFGTGIGFLQVIGDIIAPILGMMSSFLDVVVLIGATFFLVSLDETWVQYAFGLLPVSKTHRREITETVQEHIAQVFICSALLCFSHGFSTWLYFSLLGMNFAYSAAFLVGITTIFPFFSPWFVFIPALLIDFLHNGWWTILSGIGLFIVEFLMGSFVDDMIYDQIPGSQPYVTGMSIAFGVSTFGVAGFLLGPVLVVILKSFYSIFSTHLTHEDDIDEGLHTEALKE